MLVMPIWFWGCAASNAASKMESCWRGYGIVADGYDGE